MNSSSPDNIRIEPTVIPWLQSIRGKMVLFFTALLCFILLGIQLIQMYGIPYTNYRGTINEITVNQLETLTAIADSRKELIENWVRNRRRNARSLVENPIIQDLQPRQGKLAVSPQILEWLESVRSDYQLSSINLILPSSGIPVAGVPVLEALQPIDERRTISKNSEFNELVLTTYDAVSQSSQLHIILPIRPNGDPDKAPLLLLEVETSIDQFFDSRLQPHLVSLLGKTGEVVLLDSRKQFLTKAKHPLSDGSMPVPMQTVIHSKASELAISGSEGTIAAEDYRGIPALAAYRHIQLSPDVAWGMVVKRDQHEIYAALQHKTRIYWWFALFGVFITVIMALFIAGRLTRPLRRMVSIAISIQHGDLDARVDETSRGETALLARAFNSMIGKLQGWHIELDNLVRQRTEQLSAANQELQLEVAERTRAENALHEKTLLLEEEIAERQKIQEALQYSKLAAESANRAKSEFLANMSHEIRTPMNGIIGMTQLLGYTELNDEQKEYVAAITTSGNNLLSLINDILDLSKIEAMKLDIVMDNFGLRNCISEVVTTQKLRIYKKGLSVKIDVPSDVPDSLLGDQLRIKQVLLNLLGNAVKFTENGSINIAVTVVEDHGSDVLLDMSVQDSGIGIPADVQKRIFDPFTQADGSTTRNYGGTGLGLSICKRLAELMGGNIRVESVEGVGSTFYLRLPLPVATVSMQAKLKPQDTSPLWDGHPLKILLVEDNLINIKCCKTLLEKMGHHIKVDNNGRDALDSLKKESFDLILMDIQMPVMNGDDALYILRERELNSGTHLPVIALTAYALKGDKEKYLEIGFDGYLSKPVEVRKLVDEMKRVTSGS
ncbi:MAG: response regulator [Geobacteraceae bacterium]|nr:response regulator [Geobacteraceae bacterium]NTW80481.1 response regulator [Geobacteraceae bacterium]